MGRGLHSSDARPSKKSARLEKIGRQQPHFQGRPSEAIADEAISANPFVKPPAKVVSGSKNSTPGCPATKEFISDSQKKP